MKYVIGEALRIGNRGENQDRLGSAVDSDAAILVLADGMGGHAGGAAAAEITVNVITDLFLKVDKPVEDPRLFLSIAVRTAHRAILQYGQQQSPPLAPCSTCVVCLVQNDRAWWAHAGDSRLYLIRSGEVLERTLDHSHVQDLISSGEIATEDQHSHPLRHIVTQCVGGEAGPPTPAVGESEKLQEGDVLLLCSDGLWSAVEESELLARLAADDVCLAINELAYLAEQQSFPYSDNISTVVLRLAASDAAGSVTCHTPAPEADEGHLETAIAMIQEAIAEYSEEMGGDDR